MATHSIFDGNVQTLIFLTHLVLTLFLLFFFIGCIYSEKSILALNIWIIACLQQRIVSSSFFTSYKNERVFERVWKKLKDFACSCGSAFVE